MRYINLPETYQNAARAFVVSAVRFGLEATNPFNPKTPTSAAPVTIVVTDMQVKNLAFGLLKNIGEFAKAAMKRPGYENTGADDLRGYTPIRVIAYGGMDEMEELARDVLTTIEYPEMIKVRFDTDLTAAPSAPLAQTP